MLQGARSDDIFIHDFGVLDADGNVLDVAAVGDRVADAVAAVWHGRTESDGLDRLVVLAGLTWREVSWLRAMRTYLLRVSSGFTVDYQNEAFAANPEIARDLVRYFELRHDPARPRDELAEAELFLAVLTKLDAVPSLDQDRILRSYLHLIDAIVRTNAFVHDRSFLSFKIRSEAVPDMPRPIPLFEIFVRSTEMEGIHLRAGKVARGGIRWSDRMEDYRTEVLGLMKTQTTKNAVIVPTGSKGGFVVRRTVPPEELRDEVRRQYVTLIRGLLDVTDNLVGGAVVHPPGVRVLDDDDPYLVVAADKGTAAFSDTANGVSEEMGFWLGDAFASGGSAGYDHKALAITARGAWESVKRHFRELGRDVLEEPFTAVGVGDMSGDVFGNGMLYSPQTRLVAAFDHRHVFSILRQTQRPASSSSSASGASAASASASSCARARARRSPSSSTCSPPTTTTAACWSPSPRASGEMSAGSVWLVRHGETPWSRRPPPHLDHRRPARPRRAWKRRAGSAPGSRDARSPSS